MSEKLFFLLREYTADQQIFIFIPRYSFQIQTNVTVKMEQNISNLVELVESVTVRYRLASLLGLKRLVAQLINENSLYYLKDTNYGRSEQGN